MMVAVLLGALSLGACVDDNESQSVTDVRNAKAEALKATAKLDEAKAEAELIRANAEKAMKEAQAEYYKAQAAAEQATANSKEFELEKAKEKYALDLEKIKLQAQFDLQKLQDQMAEYEQGKLEEAYGTIKSLYYAYYSELSDLNGKKYDLIDMQARLAQLEAGVVSTGAWNKYYTLRSQQNIANYEAQLAVLTNETYAGLDNAELQAQAEAKYKEYNLAQVAFAKDPTCAALLATSDPVKKAAEELEAQEELLDAIHSIYYGVITGNYSSENYWVYTAVAFNSTGTQEYQSFIENARFDEARKLFADRYAANLTVTPAEELGTATDTKDKNTAYGRLAKANDDLKVANEALKTANAMPETTDEEKAAKEAAISAAKAQIASLEVTIAYAKNDLAEKQAAYDEAVAAQKEYNDAIAAFDIAAYNKAVTTFVAAVEAQADAVDAWDDAKASINNLWNEYQALYYLANNSATNINEQIANLEAQIATEKNNIETYKYNNDNSERTLEKAKADIEHQKALIEAQTVVVEAAKAALDAALASAE